MRGVKDIIEEPKELMSVINYVEAKYDAHETFDVDKYLFAVGLAVNTRYRGMSIGKEILLARDPICKELGIKLTVTMFTTKGGQTIAEKAGFSTIVETPFRELEDKFEWFRVEERFKSIKTMIKLYK